MKRTPRQLARTKSPSPKRDLTQVAAFVAAARELGADESEAEFDRALRKVASAPPAPKPKSEKRPSPKKRGRG